LPDRTIPLDELMPLIRERLAAGESVRFSPHGTSMLPLLKDGRDQVVLSPLPDRLRKYDLPLYQRENGQYVLHRIVRVSGGYVCMGDNQFVPEPGLRHEQMIGVVTQVIRKGKCIETAAPTYRLYCRLWCGLRPFRHSLLRLRSLAGRLKKQWFSRPSPP